MRAPIQVPSRRPRNGHPKEPATSLTRSAPGALLYSHLDTVTRRADLDVAGLDPKSALDAGGHHLALEEKLCESPLLALLLHPHDHAQRASPHALTGLLETACRQLAELVGDRRLLGGAGRQGGARTFG